MTRFVNVLGWIGTALVVAAVAIRFIRPEQQQLWQRLALAGLVVVLAYLVTQWRDFVALWSRRGTRAGALTSASVLLLLAILVGINYVAGRQHKRWDLTEGGQFTLSDQSRKVLDGLKTPVNVKVFAKDTEFQRFRDRLDGYTYASPQLKVEYIDPDKQPAVARQWQVQQYGTIAVDYNGRIERVTTDTEQDITNAIVKAVEGGEKKVYFSQGHGERDTTSADQRTGYNAIAGALQRDNFAVEKVVLAQQQDVPADAAVLVIAGPKNDFLQPELDMVQRYLDKGGKLLLLIDPPDGADAAPLTGLIALAKAWGVDVGTNVVVDVSRVGQLLGAGPSVPVVATYPDHPDHRELRPDHRVPAGARSHAGRRRHQRTHGPADCDDERAVVGRDRPRGGVRGHARRSATRPPARRKARSRWRSPSVSTRRMPPMRTPPPAATGARAATAGDAAQAADPCRR